MPDESRDVERAYVARMMLMMERQQTTIELALRRLGEENFTLLAMLQEDQNARLNIKVERFSTTIAVTKPEP